MCRIALSAINKLEEFRHKLRVLHERCANEGIRQGRAKQAVSTKENGLFCAQAVL